MNLPKLSSSRRRGKEAGFSLLEAAIGMGMIGTVAAALLTGVSTGMFTLRMARENARASQIMVEKLETIRLYNWSQINSNGFIPPAFVVAYDPASTNNAGPTYQGTINISTPASLGGSSYTADVRVVTVTLRWQSGGLQRQRQNTTYVSQYGLANFID